MFIVSKQCDVCYVNFISISNCFNFSAVPTAINGKQKNMLVKPFATVKKSLLNMTKQVAWNRSSLLLKNILENAQTLQWILKQSVFTKVIKDAELGGLGGET